MSFVIVRDDYGIGDGLSNELVLVVFNGENNPVVREPIGSVKPSP